MIPAEKKMFMQRARLLKNFISKIEDGPSIATKTVLRIWQKSNFPLLCPDFPEKNGLLVKNREVNEFASWLADRPFLEAAFWLSSAYAFWVGDDTRSERSLYFTPPILANRLIDNLIEQGASLTDHVWLDPACGGGAFLAPVAVRMVQALARLNINDAEILKKVSENLIGNDIDETLGFLSSQFLLMALYRQLESVGVRPYMQISLGDGLRPIAQHERRADVVICNPPYRKMKSTEVEKYVNHFHDVVEGQPNIYGLFIRQCLRLGKENAVVGLLTPTSYLSGRYFSKLREIILNESSVSQLDIIDDRVGVFIGVSQGAVLSLFKCTPRKQEKSSVAKVYTLSIARGFKSIGKCHLTKRMDSWPIPRELGDQKIIQTAASSPYRLKDYGYKPRVGTYVDYRDVRKTYTRKPNNKKMTAVFPILWSSDITTEGQVILGRTSKTDGHHTYIEMGTADHQAIIRQPAVALQRVTSPDQPRRLICAPLDDEFFQKHGGVVGENHVIFLERVAESPHVAVNVLATILSSEPIDRLFRSISGAVNVSVSELNQLNLPNPSTLAKLLQEGKAVNDAIMEAFKSG